MRVAEEAQAVQEQAIRRSDRAANAAMANWRRVDPASLDTSWSTIVGDITSVASAAMVANAASASRLTNALARADGMSGDVLVPESFSGIDGSGRSLATLLDGAIVTTKRGIAAGMSIPDAMIAGGSYLTVMLKTAMADVERSSSMAAAAGKGYVRYVRMVNPGACSRCAILAGSDRFRSNFERHPACRCSTVPVPSSGGSPDGLFDTPGDYFDSLSTAEQDRVFTQAGAESIRLGADPVKVVTARRGAVKSSMRSGVTYSPARLQRTPIGTDSTGSTIWGYRTVEGVRRGPLRGRPRLMPESIIALTDDPAMRRVLLRDAGYTRPIIRNQSNNDWIRELAAQQEADRRIAADFYRSKGIGVN